MNETILWHVANIRDWHESVLFFFSTIIFLVLSVAFLLFTSFRHSCPLKNKYTDRQQERNRKNKDHDDQDRGKEELPHEDDSKSHDTLTEDSIKLFVCCVVLCCVVLYCVV